MEYKNIVEFLKNYKYESLIVILFFYAISLTSHIFYPGLPTAWDATVHLNKAIFLSENLLPHLKIDGWYPYSFLGYQLFLLSPQMLHLVIAFLHKLSLGLISFELSLKLVMVLCYATLPIAVYTLARGFKLKKQVCVLSATLSLITGTILGYGIEGIFWGGILANAMAIPIMIIGLSLLPKACDRNPNYSYFIILIIFLLILTHFQTAIFFTIGLLLYFLIELIFRRNKSFLIKRLFLIGLVSIGISLFKIYPVIKHLELFGPIAGFAPLSLKRFLKEFFLRGFLGNQIINFLSVMGFLTMVYKRKNIFLCLYPLTIFLFALDWFRSSTLPIALVLNILKTRGFAFLCPFIAIFAAYTLDYLLTIGYRIYLRVRNKELKDYPYGIFLLLLFLILLYHHPKLINLANNYVKVESDFYHREEYWKFEEAYEWIRKNTNPNSLIAIQPNDELPFIGYAYASIWEQITYKGMRPTLGGIGIERTSASVNQFIIDELKENPDIDSFYSKVASLNLNYILVWQAQN